MSRGCSWMARRIRDPRLLTYRNWRRLRTLVIAREPWCRLCRAAGRLTECAEIDHIVPLHRGGTDALGNLQPLCAECHRRKSADEEGRRAGAPRPPRRRQVCVHGVPDLDALGAALRCPQCASSANIASSPPSTRQNAQNGE